MSCRHSNASSTIPDTVSDRPLEGKEKELVTQLLAHLTRPEITVDRIVVGETFCGVMAGGRMGLSAMLGARPRRDEKDLAQRLEGQSVQACAALVHSPSPYAISIGMAALNAANALTREQVSPDNHPADHLIADLGKDKIVGLVGEFPFVETLAHRVGTLHLFELNPVPGALSRDQWEAVLPQLDVLALTATTLLTRHMAWYLSRAVNAKIIILGPTTPVSPVLFDHGADYLCGSLVTNPDRVAASITMGMCFRDIKKRGGILFTRLEKESITR